MLYNVSQQLKEGVGSLRTHKIDEAVQYDDPAGECIVAGELKFLYTSRSILVTGRLEATTADYCSRCLEQFSERLTVGLEEEYFPVREVNTGASLRLPEDVEEGFTIDGQFTLDISDAVRQAVIVALPMSPLCKPDCQGLCPECGANLNISNCDCNRSPGDARWSALEALSDRFNEPDRNGTTG